MFEMTACNFCAKILILTLKHDQKPLASSQYSQKKFNFVSLNAFILSDASKFIYMM